ncbi:hypothetical protein H2248_002554 [Termitomyces sp. 'cryptogamus']|nr:hypothetical protein H2248_002554 [Termitomyces sp. 'cryptogamus']
MLRSTIPPISRATHDTLSLFHTSAVVSDKITKSSSRRRLTQDLREKSGSRTSTLVVAPYQNDVERKGSSSKLTSHSVIRGGRANAQRFPSKREFPRDSLPHQGLKPAPPKASQGVRASFRHGRRNNRTGKWEEEAFSGRQKPMRFDDSKDWKEVHQHKMRGRERMQQSPRSDSASGNSTQLLTSQGKKDVGRAGYRQQVQTESIRHITQSLAKTSETSSSIPELSDADTTRADPAELTAGFTSPPLMPGILSCLKEVLGPDPSPTPIQALSLKWLLNDAANAKSDDWKQFLLASETGSGKSFAYLLPVLQNLKLSEPDPASTSHPYQPQRPLNPRALILAPTHELSRQLSSFAKSLLHKVKLRVLCASRANVKTTKERDATARQMAVQLEAGKQSGEFEIKERSGFPVDVVVGTPMKLLEMVKGRGWDRKEHNEENLAENSDEGLGLKLRRGRDKMVGFGKWRNKPEMGLANVEWVVVDEADVLFDSDFQETTRQLLADISAARGQPIPLTPAPSLSQPSNTTTASTSISYSYPFNFILTSATIPASLAAYLDAHHPKLMRLASPRLHRLPKTLRTEYVSWSGGNKLADIEHRIRHVWAEDSSKLNTNGNAHHLSKVLIFCNKSTKVEELGAYLDEQDIKNIALSSTSQHRKRGSNHHLDGFLRVRDKNSKDNSSVKTEPTTSDVVVASDPKTEPHVLITTSLLSRGLDFSPSIHHVFIVDEPRNMIDFLHRAGRTGRAGERGKVVVFGKMKGRGSSSSKDVRKKVGSLVAH